MNLLYLLDLGLQSSLLLSVAWLAMCLARQPVTRLYVAWMTMGGLALLVTLSLLPHWPRQAWLMQTTVVKAPAETPLVLAIEAPAVPLELQSLPDALELEPMPSGRMAAEPMPLLPSEHFSSDIAVLPKPVPTSIPISQWLVTIWAAAALLSLGWIWLGAWQTWRVVRQAKLAPEWLQAELQQVWEELGRGPVPQLKISGRLSVASALGMFRPVILLPESQVTPALQAKLQAALRHEGAHIRQGDLWLLGLERLLLPLFCLNPLFWLVRRQIRLNQELLADAVAAGDQPVAYAEALLAWAKLAEPKTSFPIPLAGLSMWKNPHTLTRRVTMLLKNDRPTCTSTSWLLRATLGSLLFTLVLTLSLATLRSRMLLAAPPEGQTLAPIDPDADRLGEPLVPSVKDPAQVPNQVREAEQRELALRANEKLSQQAISLEVLVFAIDQNNLSKADQDLSWEKLIQNGGREGNLGVFQLTKDKWVSMYQKLDSSKAVSALCSPRLVVMNGKVAKVVVGNSSADTIIREFDNGEELRQTTLGRDEGGVGFTPGIKMSFKPHIISEGAKPHCLLDLNAERIVVNSATAIVAVHRMHFSSRAEFGQYLFVVEPPIMTKEGKAENSTTSHVILIKPELVVDGKPVAEPIATNPAPLSRVPALSIPAQGPTPIATEFAFPFSGTAQTGANSPPALATQEGVSVRPTVAVEPVADLELQLKLLALDVEEAELDAEFAELALQQAQTLHEKGLLGPSDLTQKKLLAAKAKLALRRAKTNLDGMFEYKKRQETSKPASSPRY